MSLTEGFGWNLKSYSDLDKVKIVYGSFWEKHDSLTEISCILVKNFILTIELQKNNDKTLDFV